MVGYGGKDLRKRKRKAQREKLVMIGHVVFETRQRADEHDHHMREVIITVVNFN